MSDNTKQKKLIRARQQSTGEAYSTARMHVLRSRPPDPVPPVHAPPAAPVSAFRAIVEATRALALAAANSNAAGGRALEAHLTALNPEDLRKIEVLMYAGRSDGGVRELAATLARDTHTLTVRVVADKTPELAEYLAAGLRVAAAEGIDLDGTWVRPSARWARAPGSDYDLAIDGMCAWETRYAPERDERGDAAAKRAWAEREGVVMSADGHACLLRLTHEDGGDRHPGRCVYLPGSDHTSMWMKDGKPHVYVTQPYDLTLEALDDMFRVCRRLGLTLRVDSAIAWHNPAAVLIEVRRG